MPNWVYNGLTVEGNPESVKKMIEQLNQPFHVLHDNWDTETMQMKVVNTLYPNPIFAFWNIVKPTDLEAYIGQPKKSDLDVKDEGWWADTMEIAKTDNSWYTWNMRNWGVKWDVAVSHNDKFSDTTIEEAENGENYVVHYNFNTAWGRPMTALLTLSEQYPDLLFTLSYEEATGWGGECELLRGKIISESMYDWKCRECDFEAQDDEIDWCDDCDDIPCPRCGYTNDVTCDKHIVEAK